MLSFEGILRETKKFDPYFAYHCDRTGRSWDALTGLLRSRKCIAMVTWRHTSPLYCLSFKTFQVRWLLLFDVSEGHLELTICPRHRDKFGIRWRSNKTNCTAPSEWSSHGNSVSGERGISLHHSKLLHKQAQVMLPVGSREFTTHNHLSYKIDMFYSGKSVTDITVTYLLLFCFSSEICKQCRGKLEKAASLVIFSSLISASETVKDPNDVEAQEVTTE